jgi:uncharacterized protein YkwD
MIRHRFLPLLLPALLRLPPAALGQSAHGENAESLESPAARAKKKGGPELSKVADLIVERTNEFRRSEGREPVRRNAKLTEAAADFARFMAENDKYGHNADGKTPAERAKAHGYEFCIVLENIAYQYSSAGFATEELAKSFVEGWKESPGHRKNMLDPDVTETGVAVAQSEKSGYHYAVQLFGRPHSEHIEFKITNKSDADAEYKVDDRTFTLPPRYTRTHQRCRPPELTLLGAEGTDKEREGERATARPKAGDRYVITKGDSGELTLKKE